MRLKRFDTPEELALSILEDYILPGTQRSSAYHVALSGGSTPDVLFALMAKPEYRTRVNWDHLHLYWVDERMVPPTHEQSNYGQVKRLMLDDVPLPPDHIHRIVGENPNVEDEANRYALEVYKSLSPENSQRRWVCDRPNINNSMQQARFDLVLLGVGEDGHTASIFPNRMDLLKGQALYVNSQHPESKQNRVGLSGTGICQAEQILFMITGERKKHVLSAMLSYTPEAESYPAWQVLHKRPDAIICTDLKEEETLE